MLGVAYLIIWSQKRDRTGWDQKVAVRILMKKILISLALPDRSSHCWYLCKWSTDWTSLLSPRRPRWPPPPAPAAASSCCRSLAWSQTSFLGIPSQIFDFSSCTVPSSHPWFVGMELILMYSQALPRINLPVRPTSWLSESRGEAMMTDTRTEERMEPMFMVRDCILLGLCARVDHL